MEVDLNKVMDFLNEKSGELDEDVIIIQDEEGSSQLNLQNSEISNKKRSITEDSDGVIPSKKQKSVNPEAKDENNKIHEVKSEHSRDSTPLPYFSFGLNPLSNPTDIGKLKKWLLSVDKMKKANNWTDIGTISRVLEKIKGYSEVYTWLNNISQIMTWEEWQKKLIQVFPDQDDYYYSLRKMVNRKKRPTETFLKYYEEKMELLNVTDITDKDAVSCLVAGIPETVVGCIARAGNYKTPEELVPYLETCDSKMPVVAKTHEVNVKKVENITRGNDPINRKVKCTRCKKYGNRSTKDCRDCARIMALKEKILGLNKNNVQSPKRANQEIEKPPVENRLTENAKAKKEAKIPSANSKAQSEGKRSSNNSRDERKDKQDASHSTPQEKNGKGNILPDIAISPSEHTSTVTPLKPKQNEKNRSNIDKDVPSKKEKSTSAVSPSVNSQRKRSSSERHRSRSPRPRGSSNESPKIESKERRDTTNDRRQTKNEISNKDTTKTTPREQEGEKRTKKSVTTPQKQSESTKSQRGSEDRSGKSTSSAALQEKNKESYFPTFVTPQVSGGSNSNRDTPAAAPRDNKDTPAVASRDNRGTPAAASRDNRRTPAATPRDNRDTPSASSRNTRGTSAAAPRDNKDTPAAASRDNRGTPAAASRDNRRTPAATSRDNRGTPSASSRDTTGTSAAAPRDNKDTSAAASRDNRGTPAAASRDNRTQKEVNKRGTPSAAPRDHKREGYFERRTSNSNSQDYKKMTDTIRDTSSARYQARNEESYRGVSAVSSQDRRRASPILQEERRGYFNRPVSSVREQDQREESYSRRSTFSDRSLGGDQREESYFYQDRPNIIESDDNWGVSSARYLDYQGTDISRPVSFITPAEQREYEYYDRYMSSARLEEKFEEHGIGVFKGTSSSRSQDRDGYFQEDTFERPEDIEGSLNRPMNTKSISITFSNRPEEESTYINSSMFERPEDMDGSSFDRGPVSFRRQEEQKPMYADRGISTTQSQAEENLFNKHRSVDLIEGGSVARGPSRGIRSRGEWQSDYSTEGVSKVRPQEIEEAEEEYYNRGVSSTRASERIEEDYVTRDPPHGMSSHDEWDTSYFDRGMSHIGPQEWDDRDDINEGVSGIRRQETEEMYYDRDVFGPRTEEQIDGGVNRKTRRDMYEEHIDRSYINKDASVSRPQEKKEGSYFSNLLMDARSTERGYLDRSVPSSKLQMSSDNVLSKSLPSSRLPEQSGVKESYFTKSIISTRLATPSLRRSLGDTPTSARPLVSYPDIYRLKSEPQGVGDSYFNRNTKSVSSNRGSGLNDGLFSRRSTSGSKTQDQSHTEMCLKCYTIGHDTKDCLRFTNRI